MAIVTKQQPIPVSGVWLRKEGVSTIVAVEIDGKWIDVIVERSQHAFSHIVEPDGIREGVRVLRQWKQEGSTVAGDIDRSGKQSARSDPGHASVHQEEPQIQ